MKILLIYLDPLDNEPIGLMYIGTVLKNEGHTVKLIGIERRYSERSFLKELANFGPDIVGISITTPYANKAEYIARFIKTNFPEIPVIAGGPHPTILPLEVLKEKNIDVCVIGEGERTIIELINHYERRNVPLEDIKGIAFLKNGSLVMTDKRGYIENLDDLPFVDRELLPKKTIFGRAGYPLKNPCMLITTTRGCPYQCTFCQPTVNSLFGRKVRKRSPENVIAEISELKRRYNIGGLWINDDTFALDPRWTSKFCELMNSKGMDILWWANGRVNIIKEDILKKMQEAGCVALIMTFECGSERVRNKILKKGITNTQVINAYNIGHKLGLLLRANIMLGSPTETEEEIQESVMMVKALQPHFVTASYTTPIPGTYMYSELLSKGEIDGRTDWGFYDISHFKKIDTEVTESRLKEVYRDIQRGYSGHSFTNRARHFFEVPNFRKILFKRWKSLLVNKHPNVKHLLFDIAAITIGSFSYFINKNRYTRQTNLVQDGEIHQLRYSLSNTKSKQPPNRQ
jgi:radical SAM superfamily enzyme YgiQ (UPF0313 family)